MRLAWVGATSDCAFSASGLGLGLLAMIWWNAWHFSQAPPLLSLLLFGLSATTIRWGDSLRAYGLGVFFALLTLGLIWSVLRTPSLRNVLLAMAAGVMAVQTLYQNSFVLAAFCLSAAVAAAVHRDFKRALLVASLGLPAALSVLPYLGVIRGANEWNLATQTPIGLERMWTVLSRALSDSTPWLLWSWGAALALALGAGIYLIARRRDGNDSSLSVFLVLVMASVTIAYYLFLKLAKFPTEVWYYLLWMAIMAVAIDAMIARVARRVWARATLIISTVAVAVVLFSGVRERLQTRMTNVDVIAQKLSTDAGPGDLVLLHPWFCGATFHRYYQGAAPWMTIPPVDPDGLQRLDLFKAQMQLEDPIEPVLAKAEAVLKAGGTIWLVGYFIFQDPPQPPPQLPPPGEGPEGWRGEPYMAAYGMQTTYFLRKNAARGRPVEVSLGQTVNPFENLPLSTVTGWRSQY